MNATVTDIKDIKQKSSKPTIVTDDDLKIALQRDAASRAVFRVQKQLEADLARAKSHWKDKRTEATQGYRGHLRDEDRQSLRGAYDKLKEGKKVTEADKSSLLAIAEHYFEACDGLEEHDEILAEGKADKDARAKRIKQFEAAHRELMMQAHAGDSAQVPMFAVADGDVFVMTEATKEVVYSALMQLDKDLVPLDPAQRGLLVDLGQAGLKALDLQINAEAAIERDVDDDGEDAEVAEGAEVDEDDPDLEIPF